MASLRARFRLSTAAVGVPVHNGDSVLSVRAAWSVYSTVILAVMNGWTAQM
jgi:hypothetical protein